MPRCATETSSKALDNKQTPLNIRPQALRRLAPRKPRTRLEIIARLNAISA